jgi:hypothetical protein
MMDINKICHHSSAIKQRVEQSLYRPGQALKAPEVGGYQNF